jgi:acetate kinase
MNVLCFNCGSSTLKWDLIRMGGEAHRLAGGAVDRIDSEGVARFSSQGPFEEMRLGRVDHGSAAKSVISWLKQRHPRYYRSIDAVGHRVVHGGASFREPTVLDEATIEHIERLSELAPLHNVPALAAIRACRDVLGVALPMVATFDTAFYAAMPDVASHYAIDPKLAERLGVRRYGFHGLAHRWMVEALVAESGAAGRFITLQLGNGCSATASSGGRPVDTSMGFTPLEGLVMGTRSGDVDPSLPAYVARRQGVPVEEVEGWLNRKAGLFGLSGVSSDVREILAAEKEGHRRAALALELFVYRVRKYIGAYAAALAGVEAIAFGGGIGENSAVLRERILADFDWLGVVVDAKANREADGRRARISAKESVVDIWVTPVDESLIIARDTESCLAAS